MLSRVGLNELLGGGLGRCTAPKGILLLFFAILHQLNSVVVHLQVATGMNIYVAAAIRIGNDYLSWIGKSYTAKLTLILLDAN